MLDVPSTAADVNATTFRSLVFGGSITLAISVKDEELPANADRSLNLHYIQAPRISYLPLLLADVRRNLLGLILDDAVLRTIQDSEIWFSYAGHPLRWHWPIGLLYDYHTQHNIFLASTLSLPPIASTSALKSLRRADPQPFRLTLHLQAPPLDSLMLNPSVEGCKACFMNMIKEADYVRWGSVKRVTNLKKEQQDDLWAGLVEQNFDKYWTVASKLVPTSSSTAEGLAGLSIPAPSPFSGPSAPPEPIRVRSIPIKVYLPAGAPIFQSATPPLHEGSSIPRTLQQYLSNSLPLFFQSNPSSPPLPYAIVQGVALPLESEISWLGSCLAGADGWVSIVVVLGER